jgi:hypothetical protein
MLYTRVYTACWLSEREHSRINQVPLELTVDEIYEGILA